MSPRHLRPAHIEIDASAIVANAAAMAALVAPAALCAVVKADGYGHGAVVAALAALDGGAALLAVALVEEGIALRDAGITAPVLVLSEPSADAMDELVVAGLETTLYTAEGIAAAASAAAARHTVLRVHLKVDTGMQRVGARPVDVVDLAAAIEAAPSLELASVWTHLAAADEDDAEPTKRQLALYGEVLDDLAAAGVVVPARHAANSAGAIAHPDARFDLVRCGVALFGLAPSLELEGRIELRPAMRVVAEVNFAKRVLAGSSISYGLRHTFDRDTNVATVAVGYADGVPRRLAWTGGEVLIGGRRRRIVGSVTMDQLMVDCGDDAVAVGDEVVLLGRQGDEEIGAWEWARRLDTIGYEIVCGFGPRLPRHVV